MQGVVKVYDPDTGFGVIVRDDSPGPLTLIRLEDGRIVASVECQYSPDPE